MTKKTVGMKGIRVDKEKRKIIIDAKIFDEALNIYSDEHAYLAELRNIFSTYSIERKEIKRNTSKKTYSGLTRAYMNDYINNHEPEETKELTLCTCNTIWSGVSIEDSQAFSEEYISATDEEKEKLSLRLNDIYKLRNTKGAMCRAKTWFLDRYPEVKSAWKDTAKKSTEEENHSDNVVPIINPDIEITALSA